MLKITVVGAGYVGLANAILLAQHNVVTILDVDTKKVALVNAKKSPVQDDSIDNFLKNKSLKLDATTDKAKAYKGSDFIIVAVPTNYNSADKTLDTTIIEKVIGDSLHYSSGATIVIKSTVYIGFTLKIKQKFNYNNIFFSPEFLREGSALTDNMYPDRIIIGDDSLEAKKFAKLLTSAALSKDTTVIFVGNTEAEAIKLFANSYLAMRIAYFNELDSYAQIHNLNSKDIIRGVGFDSRIGNYYNNPSFGYGGYCLPKDSKQLLAHYDEVPHDLIKAIVESNNTRKSFITDNIIAKKPDIVGVYRLVMKNNSGNFRNSPVQDIITNIKRHKITVVIYEPNLKTTEFWGCKIINDLAKFKSISSIVLANRLHKDIMDISDKIYTRDIFNNN